MKLLEDGKENRPARAPLARRERGRRPRSGRRRGPLAQAGIQLNGLRQVLLGLPCLALVQEGQAEAQVRPSVPRLHRDNVAV